MPVDSALHDSKMALDQDRSFRARARGVKLAGLWAAERLGLSGSSAEEYARSVVSTDFDEPGDEDVIARLRTELATAGVSEDEIRAALARCLLMAETSEA
jgi:hypothetical protein